MFKTQDIFEINGKFFSELNGGATYVKVRDEHTVTDGCRCKLILMNSQQGQYFEIKEVLK